MIGVFDSGLGGLCALKELCALMPEDSYLYLADTAHLPYGKRPRGDICRFSARAVSFLREQGADCVLFACGTASSCAFDFCKRYFAFELYEVVEPSVLAAVRATQSRRIGIAATEGTIKSGLFPRLFKKYDPACELTQLCCPSLVSLIESGECRDTACYDAVRECLSPFAQSKVDTVILGCTHFAFLKSAISTLLPSATIIESGKEGAKNLFEARNSGIFSAAYASGKVLPKLRLYTTGNASALSARASSLLGRKVIAEKINQDII